jgi:probable rRNA maturation factor
MKILAQCHASVPPETRRTLAQLARAAVAATLHYGGAVGPSETGVLFTDDSEMRTLNRDYRHIDRPTDVLAFAMRENAEGEPSVNASATVELLGDIVVSLDTARRQATARGHSLRREAAILLIHGALHLIGYDHPAGASGRKRTRAMREAERGCLAGLEDTLVL